MVVAKLIAIRAAIAHRVGKRVGGVEAGAHLFYGSVVFAEMHDGLTLYGVAALTLGVVSIVAVFFRGDE